MFTKNSLISLIILTVFLQKEINSNWICVKIRGDTVSDDPYFWFNNEKTANFQFQIDYTNKGCKESQPANIESGMEAMGNFVYSIYQKMPSMEGLKDYVPSFSRRIII